MFHRAVLKQLLEESFQKFSFCRYFSQKAYTRILPVFQKKKSCQCFSWNKFRNCFEGSSMTSPEILQEIPPGNFSEVCQECFQRHDQKQILEFIQTISEDFFLFLKVHPGFIFLKNFQVDLLINYPDVSSRNHLDVLAAFSSENFSKNSGWNSFLDTFYALRF